MSEHKIVPIDHKAEFIKHIEWSRERFESWWLTNHGNDISDSWHSDKRIYLHEPVNASYKAWKACFALDLFHIDAQGDTIRSKQAQISALEKQLAECRAVNLVMREALTACDEAMEYMSEYDIPITLPEQVEKALELKPGDVELVEVGYASEPSIQNMINGNDVIVGKKSDIRTESVYTIQTKSNTE